MNIKFKKLIYAATLLLLCSTLHAQQSAEKYIDNFVKLFSNNNLIEINFSCDISNTTAGIQDQMEGNIIMNITKYKIDVAPLIIINTGKETINYNQETNEATIFTNVDDDISLNPFVMLTQYEKYFVPSITSKTETTVTIKLNPKEEFIFKEAYITLNKNNNLINSLLLIDDSDTEYNYTIKKFNTKATYPATTFEFSKSDYPEITIIDMR
jgi:outer membrane lipoprotein-sorting protein